MVWTIFVPICSALTHSPFWESFLFWKLLCISPAVDWLNSHKENFVSSFQEDEKAIESHQLNKKEKKKKVKKRKKSDRENLYEEIESPKESEDNVKEEHSKMKTLAQDQSLRVVRNLSIEKSFWGIYLTLLKSLDRFLTDFNVFLLQSIHS